MSNDVPVPPTVDLDFAMQFVGQLYGAIAAIDDARKKVPEWNSQAEAAQARVRGLDTEFFAKERLVREITGKCEHEQRKYEEWTRQAEQVRQELTSVQSALDAAAAAKAALKAAL